VEWIKYPIDAICHCATYGIISPNAGLHILMCVMSHPPPFPVETSRTKWKKNCSKENLVLVSKHTHKNLLGLGGGGANWPVNHLEVSGHVEVWAAFCSNSGEKICRYPLNRRLVGPHSWAGLFGEDKKSLLFSGIRANQ
jgi:hypothetical protein